MPKRDLVLLSSINPILYGIYDGGKLCKSVCQEGKTLEVLTSLVEVIDCEKIARVFYASGPGSFTAIKLTHIFLQTLRVIKGIELFCVDSFYFNGNAPIRAFGNQFFEKLEREMGQKVPLSGNRAQEGEIVLKSFETPPYCEFALPEILFEKDFNLACEPLYVLPPL